MLLLHQIILYVSESILKLILTVDEKIRDKKIQYNINREAARKSALSSGKIDKYEHLTGEEILPYNQKQIIEQAKLAYSPLGKAFEKQTKTIEEQGKKQIKALDNRVKKHFLEAVHELNKIVGIENKLNRDDLIYKIDNKKKDKTCDFQKFKRIIYFGREIYNNDLTLDHALEKQIRLKDDINIFKESTKPKESAKKEKKR